jgi:hypothetical protein
MVIAQCGFEQKLSANGEDQVSNQDLRAVKRTPALRKFAALTLEIQLWG